MRLNVSHVFAKCVFGTLLALLFFTANSQAQLSVDLSTRVVSRSFYQSIFPASENVASGWNGNIATGNEGTTTAAFKNAVYLRVNYYRAMAGVSGGIVDKASYSADAQKAALMMTSNNDLRHKDIPTSWINYSAAGANAASHSNLFLGVYGTEAIDGYMEDWGTGNEAAGHRRWILYPQTTQMGTGDLPPTSGHLSANALWIYDTTTFQNVRPLVRDTFVAWPPKGYVPYQFIYPRWSFSYPGADFSAAIVGLQRNGGVISVRKEAITGGYGENTLVFIPDDLSVTAPFNPVAPMNDTTTTVSISNVKVGSGFRSFSYNVTAFDPATDGTYVPITQTVSTSGTLNFGKKKVKTKSYRYLSIRNYGNSPLTIASIKYPFGFSGKWAGTIAPGGSHTVKITFYPTSRRSYKGNITIRSDATAGLNTRSISGIGK